MDEFVQEYLYIEDYYQLPVRAPEKEEEEDVERVIVIDIFGEV